jgi:hypothetical protein
MQPLIERSPSLRDLFARLSALDEYLSAEVGPLDAGWHRAPAFATSEPPLLEEGLALAVAEYPNAERRVAGSFLLGNYAWYVPAATIGAFVAERRVPDMAADNVALRYSTYTWEEDGESGEAMRIDVRFLSERFAALPDDPAAGADHVLVLPDEDTLRSWLRTSIEAHMAPLVEAISARTHLGRRAQWNLIADSVAAMFLHAGQLLNSADTAQCDGLAVVKAAGSPLRNRDTGYVTVEAAGHCETFRTRGGCCLYYRLKPGENCSTCVLRPAAERIEKLRNYVASKHAVEVAA